MHHMLFCDDPSVATLMPQWLKRIGRFFGAKPETAAKIRERAERAPSGSREQALAFFELRQRGEPVPAMRQLTPRLDIRQPPPREGRMRFTIIGSDGFYVVNGSLHEPTLAAIAPLFEATSELIEAIVKHAQGTVG